MVACALLVNMALLCGLHEHSATHCCDLCHFGFVPWIQPVAAPAVARPNAPEWRLVAEQGGRAASSIQITLRGRAPPAC